MEAQRANSANFRETLSADNTPPRLNIQDPLSPDRQSACLKMLLKSTPNIIIVVNQNGCVEYCSDLFVNMVGQEKYTLIQNQHFKVIYELFAHDSNIENAYRVIDAARSTGKTANVSVSADFERRGKNILYAVSATPLFSEDHVYEGLWLMMLDTTDFADSEMERHTQIMLDSMPFTCVFWDENAVPIDCNWTTVEFFGCENKQDYLDRFYTLSPRYQPDGSLSSEKAHALLLEIMRDGTPKSFHWEHIAANGDALPVKMFLIRVAWKDGFRVAGYAYDMRETMEQEKIIQETNKRVQKMLDATPMACVLQSATFNEVIDCNEEAVRMFGVSRKSDLKSFPYAFIPELQPDGISSVKKVERIMQTVLETGYIHYTDWMYQTVDGQELPAELFVVRIQWDDGIRLISYSRDMRQAKAYEEKMREIDRQNQKMEIQMQAAQSELESKSLFIANMSHEIRTPMNAIIGMSDLIRTDNMDDKQKDFIESIRKLSKTLLKIINDILDFSKIEAGKMTLTPVHFSLLELFDNACSLNGFMAKEKGLKFIGRFDPDAPQIVYGDDVRLNQIVTNILSNAIKYTMKGVVEFRVKRVKKQNLEYTAFIVSDTGVGIRKEDLPRLFQTYDQLGDKKNRRIVGTGLGLYISNQLIKMMDGHIEVASTYGEGSTFTIFLPLLEGDPSQIETIQDPPQSIFMTNGKANVLVVDDNPINHKVTLAYLARHNIYADSANSGKEALEKIRRKRYHLLFIDHIMPEMDGLETTARIRALGGDGGWRRNVPIIALSANVMEDARKLILDSGVNDFLSKPISPRLLNQILLKWLPAEFHSNSAQRPDASLVRDPGKQKEDVLIDSAQGLANSANSADLYRQLLEEFSSIHGADYEKIADALDARNLDLANRLAHTLKSSAALIGAQKLSAAARDLEQALTEGEHAHVPQIVETLGFELSAVSAQLKSNATPPSERKSDRQATRQDADLNQALSLIQKLRPLLQSGSTDSLDLLNDIDDILAPIMPEESAALAKSIKDFEFSDALDELESILNGIEPSLL
jgi:signal transduction histidine kinase/CheY-like chemotaxis protein/HPt (histidine-containing phosphotransfer) domain-containing protein